MLVAPDFTVPFKLAVDACDFGVGAVLIQPDVSGIDRLVAIPLQETEQPPEAIFHH